MAAAEFSVAPACDTSTPPIDRSRLRRWLFESAREAFVMALNALRHGNPTLARRWLATARSLRVAAHACANS